jgi:2-polyprenyl-3-methyl-5-hydroxy-6-metoxy-1,4-benzoquinol methylase
MTDITKVYYEKLWKNKLKDKKWLANDGKGRVEFHCNIINNLGLHSDVKILDIGCGRGTLRKYLSFKNIYGVDISKEALKEAKKVYLNTVQVDLDKKPIPFKDNSFDIVVCLGVIEHIFNPLRLLQECHRALKKNGTLFLLAPNILSFRNILRMIIKRRFPKTSIDDIGYDGGHIAYFSHKDLAELVAKSGFRKYKFNLDCGKLKTFFGLGHKLFPTLFSDISITAIK